MCRCEKKHVGKHLSHFSITHLWYSARGACAAPALAPLLAPTLAPPRTHCSRRCSRGRRHSGGRGRPGDPARARAPCTGRCAPAARRTRCPWPRPRSAGSSDSRGTLFVILAFFFYLNNKRKMTFVSRPLFFNRIKKQNDIK